MPRVPSTRPRSNAALRRRLNLRRQLWPDVEEGALWNRADFTGFTTIPRTLALVMRIIDDLDPKSAGRVYFDLWARSFDDYVVEIRDEYDAAYVSGYEGQRAIRTWRERVGVLEQHGFVRTSTAPHGAYRFVLILDPHSVVEGLHRDGFVSDEAWLLFTSLLISIGQLKQAPN